MTEEERERHPDDRRTPDPEIAETIRRRLTDGLDRILEMKDPLARLETLICAMLEELEAAPTLAVSLATDPQASTGNGGRDRLVSTIKNLMASLVGDAQEAGAIRGRAEAEPVDLLYGGLLSTLLRWGDDGCPADLPQRGLRLFDLWCHGAAGDEGSVREPAEAGFAELRELDVRPVLDRDEDPLQTIRDSLGGLASGSLLHITAPFRPTPLEALLSDAGHTVDVVPVEEDVWSVVVVVNGACEVADLRDREPPEPLEAVLTATVRGGPYVARLPRLPRLLAPHLDQRGLTWRIVELEDGTALIWIAP